MRWSLQRPARKAVERNEAEIARWVAEEWPRIVQTPKTRRAWLCFIDESGVKLTPPVRRTWAPKARTPVLRHPYRRGIRAGGLPTRGWRRRAGDLDGL
jgi:hypothetical protein